MDSKRLESPERLPVEHFGFDPSHCFIGGAWQPAVDGDVLALKNPSNNITICDIARGTSADIDAAVLAAQTALRTGWGRASALDRGRLLMRLGQLVLDNVEELARLEAMDVGKPLKQARADAIALARYCEFYAGAADKVHGNTLPYLDGYTAYTLREPHGITGHIVPWNYPCKLLVVLSELHWQWVMPVF